MSERTKKLIFSAFLSACAIMAVLLIREGWLYHSSTVAQAFDEELRKQSWRSPAAAVGNTELYILVRPFIICGALLLIPGGILVVVHWMLFSHD